MRFLAIGECKKGYIQVLSVVAQTKLALKNESEQPGTMDSINFTYQCSGYFLCKWTNRAIIFSCDLIDSYCAITFF